MMHILRDSGSGICMCGGGGFRSNGAQVSWLVPPSSNDGRQQQEQQAHHWFTATPDPQRSVFKPFSFSFHQGQQDAQPCCSPHTAATPAPRNSPHALWHAWQAVNETRGGFKTSQAALQELEVRGLEGTAGLSFAAAVAEELRLYGAAAAAATS
jgi:secernin